MLHICTSMSARCALPHCHLIPASLRSFTGGYYPYFADKEPDIIQLVVKEPKSQCLSSKPNVLYTTVSQLTNGHM